MSPRNWNIIFLILGFFFIFNVFINIKSIVELFGSSPVNQGLMSTQEEDLSESAISKSLMRPNCENFSSKKIIPPLANYSWQGTGLVTLWFDDAWRTQYTVAFPLMEEYGYKGAISVAVKLLCHQQFMTWNELQTLQNSGWEVTSHSMSHICDVQYYNDKTTIYELLASKQTLLAHGLRANQFVMPCGISRYQIEEAFTKAPPVMTTAQKYYQSYRTTQYKRINPLPVLDPYNLKAFQIRNTTTDADIDYAIRTTTLQKGWLILVFHQISPTNQPFNISSSRFKMILEKIKASGLPVVLPAQALAIQNKPTTK